MWRLGIAVVVVLALMSPPAASGQNYTFGDWARDEGYLPGDAMPSLVGPAMCHMDSLDGIDEFDWTTTPTITLHLDYNELSSVESGGFQRTDQSGVSEYVREPNIEH